jgi:2-polyprenyl-3-methyl-5-hydroxy-6-metoxy-1,4-benzoquinol methylase
MTHCPGCHSDRLDSRGNIPATNRFAGHILKEMISGTELRRCLDCHLQFRWPRPSGEQMATLHSEMAGEWEELDGERNDWNQIIPLLSTIPADGAILDVGCFAGSFLERLNSGYRRFGIEINREAARLAAERAITIIGHDYSICRENPEQFDAVVAIDVIEHVSDPLEFLATLLAAVRPGGILIISTGNTAALAWRLMKSRYWYCTVGEHVSFINPEWCAWAARRLGIDIDQILTFSHFNRRRKQAIQEAAINLLYRFLPGLLTRLRRGGLGGIDLDRYPELADHPPFWFSARDHLAIRFRKPRPAESHN